MSCFLRFRTSKECRSLRLVTLTVACLGVLYCPAIPARGQGTQPIVAVHDSELTRALESMPASGATPTGPGTTGNQWWPTNWHYFVMPDSVKETLRSDGTAFTVVGDSNIMAGVLTNADGSPKYPIVISLASEAVDNGEIAQLTNYVAAGGFLFVGSSSFTRNTNGTTRGDFAIANAMGVDMVVPALTNWFMDTTFTKISNHPLLSMFPGGPLEWQMPSSSDEISWPVNTRFSGEDPDATDPGLPHMVWQVQANGATVIAQGDLNAPYLLVESYGKGYFIYDAAMQPLLGHGGWAPGMYAYSILRNAIQWAFQSAGLPVVKRSPWPYPYNAAVMFRHDMEAIPTNIISIENSAEFEHTNGASGDYYFCTGTLRLDMPNPTLTNTIASLQLAISLYGATINAHNGGFTNINNVYNPPLISIESHLGQLMSEGWLSTLEPYTDPILAPFPSTGLEYDYWHWSPDEILDLTNLPPGYASGSAYALASISNSLVDLAGWGLTNGTPRAWVAPYFNATREGSFQIEQQLGIKIAGETKLSPFPHWTLSTQTPDLLYPTLQLPVSDWFVSYQGLTQIAQAMEAGHTTATVQSLVDAYYNLGALLNLYCHSESPSGGPAGSLPGTYVTYSLSKPRIWSTNATGIYTWWLQQSNAQVSATYTNINGQCITSLSIAGEGNTNAAVEILAPSASYSALQVSTNGTPAGTNIYRTNGQVIKVLVGTSVSNAVISYLIPPTAQDDVFTVQQGSSQVVSAPGVLTNDTAGSGGGSLTATLVSGPENGSLTLNADGSFTYTPTGNYTGADAFSYQAVSGSLTSAVATVTLMVLSSDEYVYDTFTRPTNTEDIFPWVQELGAWNITNNALAGTSPLNSYGYAYYGNNASWNDFSVQAQIQFSSTNGLGGGIGGRLNPVNGAHYAAWVYPEGSSAGPGNGTAVLQLVKFETWTAFTLIGNPITLPGVGTNPHTLRLAFQTNSIAAYFDGVLETNVTDNGSIDESPAYTNGTVSLDMYTDPNAYTMTADNVIVSAFAVAANNDSYTASKNTALHIPAPGVLANDSGGIGSLTAILVGNPSYGGLTLTNNGGFTYTPANNFTGVDSFTYEATDGQTTSGVATATITVNNSPVANNDSYVVVENTTLTVGPPGILANDTGGNGSLSAILVSGPSNGTLALTNNGSFSYTPANNYTGSDSFTYQATDGVSTSGVATVTFTVTDPPTANNDIYGMIPGTILNVSAPGVLTNDTGGVGSLSAVLASTPLHGILNLNSSGGFGYQPTNNFFGIDDFTYQATDGTSTSAVAAVAVEVTPIDKLLVDNFTRSLIWPWVIQSGSWSITNNALMGVNNSGPYAYGDAYISNNWTDYVVQGQIQFSSTNAWGGGIGGRVNPTTGAHYAAWVYPEGSQGDNYPGAPTGLAVLKLIRFTGWGANMGSTYTVMAQVNLPNVGNNWHTVQMAFQGTNIVVSFDGTPEINTNDSASFASGGINVGMYSDTTLYTLSVSNVVVAPLVANDSFTVGENTTLNMSAPGILTNDTDVYGAGLTAALVSGPANGTLTLTNNGGFSYTPTTSFVGTDSFIYSASSGATNLGTATVTLTVIPTLTVSVNSTNRVYGATNPVFTVSYSGFVNGDGTNVLTGSPTITTTATTNSPVGNYAITISQGTLSATNYNFVFVNGTLTVTQAVVTVASGLGANGKSYDRTTTATISSNNVVLAGVLAGDASNVKLSTNGYVANFVSPNVGTGIAVTVSGLTLTGSAAGNYTLSQPTGLSNNITALGITISSGITANGKPYDRTTTATLSSNNVVLAGVLAGDVSNVKLSTNGYVANFVSPNVGTGIGVTVSGLTLTGSAAGNYTLSQPTGLSNNITALGVTISSGLSANGKPYDGTTAATISSNSVVLAGILAGDASNVKLSTNGYVANFVSPNVGTGIGVTVSGLTLTGSAAGNYTLSQPTGLSNNITALGVTISSGITANGKPYDGTTTATLSSNNVVLAGILAGDVSNVKLSTNGYVANFVSPNVGTGIGVTVSGLTLTGSAAGNYTLSQPTGLSNNITALGVTISSGITANGKPYDGTTTATLSSNNVVLAGILAGDVSNVKLSTNGYVANFVSPNVGTGIGVTVSGLTLTGSAAGNYTLSQPTGLSNNITALGVTISSGITANSKPYDGTTAATISSNSVVLAGVLAGDVSNVQLSTNGYVANFVSPNVGTGIGVTVSGLTLTGSAAGNYTLSQPTGLSNNITALGVTISSGITANGKPYDGTTTATISSNSVVLAGVLAGDVSNVKLSTNGYVANFVSPNVGTGIGVTVSGLTLTGSAAGNYTLSQPTGLSNNITALGVTISSGITANGKPYDGTTAATISSNSVVLAGVLAGDVSNVKLSTNGYVANFVSPNVGTGIGVTVSGLTLTGSAAGNYTLSQPTGLSNNITALGVTISSGITANGKPYDGTTAATISSNSVVLAGVLAGDVSNVKLSTNGYVANFVSPNVGTGIGVTVSGLTLTGSAAGNYTLSQPTGLSNNITALGVTISSGITANGKPYDGTTAATISSNNVVLAGVLAGDVSNVKLSTNGYVANFVSPNVGTGIGVTVSGLTLTGSAAGNYTLSQPTGLSNNITALGVTISSGITANGKPYDGTTTATLSSNNVVLAGILAGDVSNVKLSTNGYVANFVSPNVGTGIGVTVSGLTLTGSAAGNYTLSQPTGLSNNITALGVTISSGITANGKPYDGTTAATISSNSVVLAGVLAGDVSNVKLSTNGYVANFVSPNVGTGIGVTVSGLTLTGSAAGNYTLSQPTGLSNNITALGVTISSGITANGKPYDGTTAATISSNNVVLAGILAGDVSNVKLSTNGYVANFVSPNVGTGIGVTVSGLTLTGSAAGNYTLSQPTGLSNNITALGVTISSGITANGKPYDGTTAATISSNSVVLAGVLAGDVSNVKLSTNGYVANFVSPNVGTGIGVTVSGLTLTGSAAGNYTLSQPTGLSNNITALGVTISSGITANGKPYDGTTTATLSSNNVVLAGILAGDVSNVKLSTNGYVANFVSPNVGTGIGVTVSGLTLTGSAAGNYTLSQPTGLSNNITALGVTISSGITANGKPYDGTTAATISSNSVVLAGVLAGDVSNVKLSTNGYVANFVSPNVGTGIGVTVSGLTLTGSAAGNYTLSQPTGLSNNITALGVTISSGITANGKPYDGTTTATLSSNNVVLAGILAGDVSNVKLSTNGYVANFVSPNVGTGIGVTVSGLTLTGSAAGNYTLSQPTGLSNNITALGVTISSGITANGKPYDGTTTATLSSNNVVLAGILAGDVSNVKLSTNGYVANFVSPNVGTGIGVTVSGLTLTGSAAGNYTLSQPTGLSANIASRTVTVLTVPSPVITSVGLTNGIVTIAWNSVPGGMYRVQYNNNLNGTTWSNLSPDVVATGLTATQTNFVGSLPQQFYRILVLNPGLIANNKIYDGTTTATLSSNNVVLAGVLAGDTANVTLSTNGYVANFASPNVGTGIGVTVSGLTLTGSAAGNYTLSQPVGLSASITPAVLTVSAVNQNMTYGLSIPPLTASYSGFVNGEDTNVLSGAPSLSVSATTNSLPGTYTITVGPGTLFAVDYTFTFINGILTVVAVPELNGLALNGSQFVFSWPTVTGQSYQLQYRDNLATGTWTSLGGLMPGTGNPVMVTNILSASPQRFFRVVVSY
jgi:hypothetical protein